MVVGKNTYVTITEADEYITAYKKQYDPLRVHWSVLEDEEKAMLLKKALQEIERLPFSGSKREISQDLAFPRIRKGVPFILSKNPLYVMANRDTYEIPEEVKQAQIENALGFIRKEYKDSVNAEKFSVYGLGVNPPETAKESALTSEYAAQLLNGWMGGYRA